mmetsp:Transcript_25858/g.67804  ORF Transcript_25858/g.67804 Transcript_25858/m.67804 type:complete len:394 (-) Transcript_25858:1201-2382(-)
MLKNLGRHIQGRASQLLRSRVVEHAAHGAHHVHELQFQGRHVREHKIFRLDVAMHHVRGVNLANCRQHLLHQYGHKSLLYLRLGGQPLLEIRPREALHNVVGSLWTHTHLKHVHNVRLRDPQPQKDQVLLQNVTAQKLHRAGFLLLLLGYLDDHIGEGPHVPGVRSIHLAEGAFPDQAATLKPLPEHLVVGARHKTVPAQTPHQRPGHGGDGQGDGDGASVQDPSTQGLWNICCPSHSTSHGRGGVGSSGGGPRHRRPVGSLAGTLQGRHQSVKERTHAWTCVADAMHHIDLVLECLHHRWPVPFVAVGEYLGDVGKVDAEQRWQGARRGTKDLGEPPEEMARMRQRQVFLVQCLEEELGGDAQIVPTVPVAHATFDLVKLRHGLQDHATHLP